MTFYLWRFTFDGEHTAADQEHEIACALLPFLSDAFPSTFLPYTLATPLPFYTLFLPNPAHCCPVAPL